MTTRRFRQVDVFTAVPYAGNPVAVVLDAEGIDDDLLQRFAAWTRASASSCATVRSTWIRLRCSLGASICWNQTAGS